MGTSAEQYERMFRRQLEYERVLGRTTGDGGATRTTTGSSTSFVSSGHRQTTDVKGKDVGAGGGARAAVVVRPPPPTTPAMEIVISTGTSDSDSRSSAVHPRSFSAQLLKSVHFLQRKIMRTPLMSLCIAGSPNVRKSYAHFVAALYHIYTELEYLLEKDDRIALHKFFRQGLHRQRDALRRLPNLEQDLRFFFGEYWKTALPAPGLATIRYIARLHDSEPHQLAVHHWTRYGAGLAGGQYLSVSLARAFGGTDCGGEGDIFEDSNNCHSSSNNGGGVRYHQFEKIEGGDIPRFYLHYLEALDRIGTEVTLEQRKEMFAEARVAFELNIALVEEVMQMHAPAEGDRAKL